MGFQFVLIYQSGRFPDYTVLYGFSLFSYLCWGITELFQKHSSEQLIIGEAVSFQNYMHRISGCDQIFVDKRKTIFILIFQKSNAHFFLKETTKISCLETGDVCNLIQGDWFLLMFCNIVQDGIQPVHFFFLMVDILWKYLNAEIMIQLKHKFKNQAVKT